MKTQQITDGGAFNLYASWWRSGNPIPGVTWRLVDYSGPHANRQCFAVVDDFGNLIRVDSLRR